MSRSMVITGAGGFVGTALCDAASKAGWDVTAITRKPATAALENTGATCVQLNLNSSGADAALAERLTSQSVLVHLATEMTGDWAAHTASTLPAMKAILDAVRDTGAHLVHLSSIMVYDFDAIPSGAIVDEDSPLECAPKRRDGYARAKIAQEQMMGKLAPNATALRPGAIYGPNHVMNAHIGISAGPILLRLAAKGQVPLCHLSTCIAAILSAAETRAQGAVNVVDSDLPDRVRFLNALAQNNWPQIIVPLSWRLLAPAAWLFDKLRVPAGKLPGLLRWSVLQSRMKPFAYDNARLKGALGVSSAVPFETRMQEVMRNG